MGLVNINRPRTTAARAIGAIKFLHHPFQFLPRHLAGERDEISRLLAFGTLQ